MLLIQGLKVIHVTYAVNASLWNSICRNTCMSIQRLNLLFVELMDVQRVFDKEESCVFIEWVIKSTKRKITESSLERNQQNLLILQTTLLITPLKYPFPCNPQCLPYQSNKFYQIFVFASTIQTFHFTDLKQ